MAKNKWLQELDEIGNEDMPRPDEEELSAQEGFWDRDKKLLLSGAGAGFVFGLIIFLIIAVLTGSGEQRPVAQGGSGLGENLDKLEKRLANLEQGQAAIQESMAQMFKNTQSLEENVGNLDASLSELKQQFASPDRGKAAAESKMEGAAKEEQVADKKESQKGKRHVVQEGENLYRISLKYGVSVEKLRSLNDLQPDEAIYPGQELIVGQAD